MSDDTHVTASEMYLLRLMRENAHLRRNINNLKADLVTRDVEIGNLKRTIKAQADGIEDLSKRVNDAEGRR